MYGQLVNQICKMIHEKIFSLSTDREAKIIIKGNIPGNSRLVTLDFEFLIKDKNDAYFRSPIGINHPQYWKLKRATPEKSQLLELEYSGISRKQLNLAIREFKQLIGIGYVFNDTIRIEERIKTLKGLRGNTVNRRESVSA